MTEIQKQLFELQDIKYKDFHKGLIPNISEDAIIGIRIPVLRNLAKKLWQKKDLSSSMNRQCGVEGLLEKQTKKDEVLGNQMNSGEISQTDILNFMNTLPHQFYEENNLHAFFIEQIKDFDECISELEKFLPFVDNWATCDSMRPKCFKKNTERLLPKIREWIKSPKTYTCRFGIEALMCFYLDDNFSAEYLELVANVKSEEYYVNMMIAWFFATALTKQWNATIPYLTQRRLEIWCHNKTIQKAIESYRITDEQKKYLRTLKTN